ncbi:alpha/beta hydrolase [Nannocystaceae bacterium ST9]
MRNPAFLAICALTSLALLAPSPARAFEPDDPDAYANTAMPLIDFAILLHPKLATVLNEVHRSDLFVPVGGGQTIHVVESWSLRSQLRWPRRAAVSVSGPITNTDILDVEVEGYDMGARFVERGYFHYAVDPLGYGDSSRPADGSLLTIDAQVGPLEKVLKFARTRSKAGKVDLVSESTGGAMSLLLAKWPHLVRSVTVSTILYKEISAFGAMVNGDPNFEAYLLAQPNGYVPYSDYTPYYVWSPPEVQAWFDATQPDLYPTGPFLALIDAIQNDDFPYAGYDISNVSDHVEYLVLVGNDFISTQLDAQILASELGADLVYLDSPFADQPVFPPPGHTPRLETIEVADAYWSEVFEFVDPQ